jgi:hypothetical protein
MITSAFTMKTKRALSLGITVAAQSAALILGCAWGYAASYQVDVAWIPGIALLDWRIAGPISSLAIFAQGLHHLASARLLGKYPTTPWLCAALGAFAIGLMLHEPFVNYRGNRSFVTGVLLMVPLFLAVGPLARSQAWLAICGVVIFLAACLSLLIVNACNSRVSVGFFFREAA